jgi:signal peptidase II
VKRRLELLLLIAILIAVDQQTKAIARRTLLSDLPRHFGIVTLLYTTNAGAFLSIGANLPADVRAAIFSGIVTIALGAAAIALFGGKIQSAADEVALSLILGGGIGNLIDRLRFSGRVTDFIYMAAGPLHTGVFNIADMAITAGILWLLVSWGAASYSSMRKRTAR